MEKNNFGAGIFLFVAVSIFLFSLPKAFADWETFILDDFESSPIGKWKTYYKNRRIVEDPTPIYTCKQKHKIGVVLSEEHILGGPLKHKNYRKKEYRTWGFYNLATAPSHSRVRVSMDVWFIDDWENEWIQIQVIGIKSNGSFVYREWFGNENLGFKVVEPTNKGVEGIRAPSLCGKTDRTDSVTSMSVELPGSLLGVRIVVRAGLDDDSDNESWGIDNVRIELQ